MKKRNKKLLPFCLARPARTPSEQEFFGSFFQKRTSFLAAAPRRCGAAFAAETDKIAAIGSYYRGWPGGTLAAMNDHRSSALAVPLADEAAWHTGPTAP